MRARTEQTASRCLHFRFVSQNPACPLPPRRRRAPIRPDAGKRLSHTLIGILPGIMVTVLALRTHLLHLYGLELRIAL
jgi:hypothetical protein